LQGVPRYRTVHDRFLRARDDYSYMRIDRQVFVRLMLGTFLTLILAFVVRGTSTVVVGSETAQVVAAPVFVFAVGMAAAAFLLSVLVKLGLVDTGESTDADGTGG
jgi:hypothetical protein